MKTIDLTNPGLFEPLVEIEVDDLYIDLHNDYYCTHVHYEDSDKLLRIGFDRIELSYAIKQVIVEFKGVELVKMSLLLINVIQNKITLDTFYRGRFEVEGGLKEYSNESKPYFYVNFDEDYVIELFASSVTAIFK